MDLAWLFIRKPKVEAHEVISKEPDPVGVSDWAWAVMVALVGCFTAYLVHGSPDQDFPSGRGGIYFWICVGVLILAPVYLLDHLFGRERGNALATGVVFTLFCVGPLVLMAWPASLNLLYAPQEPTTWESVGKALGKTGGFAIAWSFITGLFALGAWWSAWSVFAKARKR